MRPSTVPYYPPVQSTTNERLILLPTALYLPIQHLVLRGGKKPADTVLQTVKHRPLNSGQVQAEGPPAPAVIVKDNNPRCITLRVDSQELVMTV